MAKITRKQIAVLRSALQSANRAKQYILNPAVAVAQRSNSATTTLHYTRADGNCLYEVTKEYGSDLCGLIDCIKTLEQFIERERYGNP